MKVFCRYEHDCSLLKLQSTNFEFLESFFYTLFCLCVMGHDCIVRVLVFGLWTLLGFVLARFCYLHSSLSAVCLLRHQHATRNTQPRYKPRVHLWELGDRMHAEWMHQRPACARASRCARGSLLLSSSLHHGKWVSDVSPFQPCKITDGRTAGRSAGYKPRADRAQYRASPVFSFQFSVFSFQF
jgi:hypothetical protein